MSYFFPRSFRPFPTPLATDLSPFVNEFTITPVVVPTAKRIAVTVNPYVLKTFLTLSLSDSLSSRASLSFSRISIHCLFSIILSFLWLCLLLLDLHFNPLQFFHLLEWIYSVLQFLHLFHQSKHLFLNQELFKSLSLNLGVTFVL